VAGGDGRIATAFDRIELISDASTAILAGEAGFTVVMEDRNFDMLAQLIPGLQRRSIDGLPSLCLPLYRN
jgi:hypothetical protein